MAYLTKREIEEIINNAPPGTNPAGIVAALRQQGHQLEGMAEMQREDPNQDLGRQSTAGKVAGFLGDVTGVTKLAQGAAAAINAPRNERLRGQANEQTNRTRQRLVEQIQDNRKEGKDTTRLERALAQLNESDRITNANFTDMADLGVSNRDVIGSAVRTAGTIASFGTYGTAAQGAQTGMRLRNVAGAASPITTTSTARGVLQGAATGAKTGAKGGTIFGALQGLGLGIEDEEASAGDVAARTIGGGLAGGITGGLLGGLIGGVGGGFKARANFKRQLAELVPETNRPVTQRIQAASTEVAEELGDNVDEVKYVQARNRVASSQTLPIDEAIQRGDVTPQQIYSDPTKKILQPDVAKGRVLDIRLKLNAVEDGLGDAWATNVNTANTTYDDIVQSGLNTLDDHARAKAIPVRGNVQRPGTPSATAAPFKIDPKTGKVVDDIDAITLMKTTGLEADDVAMLKAGTKADREAISKMVKVATNTSDDPLTRSLKRPEGVVGQTSLKRIRGIVTELDEAGRNIDKTVRTQLASRKVNTKPIYDKWVQDLAADGIEVLDDGTLRATPDSRFYTNATKNNIIKGASNALEEAHEKARRLNSTATPAPRVNAVKNQLDEILDYGNNTDTGLSGAASRLAKGLRREADGILDRTFTEYNTANQRYSIAKRGLEEIESVMGKNNYAKDLRTVLDGTKDDTLLSQRLGTIIRRLNSDAPESALRLTTALDDTAYKLDLPVNDSVAMQAYYANIVRDIYPKTVPKNSITGIINKAGEQAAAGRYQGARDFVNRPIGRTGEAVIDMFDATTNNPEVRQAALEKYITQLLAN